MTPAQETLILAQIGRPNNQTLRDLIPTIEDEYAEKAALSPRLVFLYVKRELIDVLLGGSWEEVNHKEGDEQENATDKTVNLHKLRETVQTKIDTLESGISSGVVAAGQLLTTAPVAAPAFGPDPNDRRYAGDALRQTSFWEGIW